MIAIDDDERADVPLGHDEGQQEEECGQKIGSTDNPGDLCHDDDGGDVHHNAYNVDEDGDDDTYSLSVDGVNSEKKCCNQGGARWHIEVTPVLIFVTHVSRLLIINIIIL